MTDRKPNNPFDGQSNPLEAMAAATALGVTVATQAMGFWLSMLSGVTAAARPGIDEAVAPKAKPVEPKTQEPAKAEKAAGPAKAVVEPVRPSAEIVELKPMAAPKPKAVKPAPKAKPEAVDVPEKILEPVSAAVEVTPEPVVEAAKPVETVAAVDVVPAAPEAETTKAAPVVAVSREEFRRPTAQDKPVQPDDLKQIKGVGPKLEVTLNGLGIWTYGQIATLEPAEIAWLDDYLGLSGRIVRDGWVGAARAAGNLKNTEETAQAGGDNG